MTSNPTPVQLQGTFGLGDPTWIRLLCIWGSLQGTTPSWNAWSIPKFLIWVRTTVSRRVAEYLFLSWKGINNLKWLDKSISTVEPKRPKLYPVFVSAARVAVNNGRSVLGTLRICTEPLCWLLSRDATVDAKTHFPLFVIEFFAGGSGCYLLSTESWDGFSPACLLLKWTLWQVESYTWRPFLLSLQGGGQRNLS